MAIGAALLVVSALATAFGGYQQYVAGRQQKKVANYNRAVAEREAVLAKAKAAREEKQFRKEAASMRAKQRALFAKSGVRLEGTPSLLLEETASAQELDALAIRYGGSIAASRAKSEARLYGMQGKQAMRAGRMGAFSSLLQAGTMAAGAYKPKPPKTPTAIKV